MGIIVSVASGIACILGLASVTLSASALPEAILRHLPSILIVGAVIGWAAHSLEASVWLVVIGAAAGWIIGSLITTYFFATLGLDTDQVYMQFIAFAAQTVFGIVVGLVPVMARSALKRKR